MAGSERSGRRGLRCVPDVAANEASASALAATVAIATAATAGAQSGGERRSNVAMQNPMREMLRRVICNSANP
jgi:hypothetical protein